MTQNANCVNCPLVFIDDIVRQDKLYSWNITWVGIILWHEDNDNNHKEREFHSSDAEKNQNSASNITDFQSV